MPKVYLGDLQKIEEKLSGDIAAAKREDIFYPVIVVVPDNLTGVYLRRTLARYGGSYCRVRFLTLDDLAAGLAENSSDYILRRAMPPFGEQWMAVLTARKASEGYFGPVAGRPGFSEALQQTFRELEGAGLKEIPRPAGGDLRRIAGLEHLYQHYRGLSSPFVTREATLEAAARSMPPPPFLLCLYCLYQLSVLEKKMLAALAAHNETIVYWQESAACFAAVEPVLLWFRQKGFTVERLPRLRDQEGNLALLQKNLFQPSSGGPVSTAGDRSLQFVCAPDEIGEVEEITREIIGLARSGLRFGEMAVLWPGKIYAELFRERFAAAGIPYYLAGGIPLSQTRTGRSFLLLLKIWGGGYTRREMMELFTYAPFEYCRILGSETPVNTALWDHLTMEAGVLKGRLQWREALERYYRRLRGRIREQNDEESETAAERVREKLLQVKLLLRFLGLFFKAMDRLSACSSWESLTGAAVEITESFFYPGEERETLGQLLKELQRLDECSGEFELRPALELLQNSLQTTVLPRGKFQQEGVNLLPLSHAAGMRFSVLFIPGLVEKIIPAPAKPDPLLPETERLLLSGKLPLRRQKLELEALRFTLALGGADQKAVLTWPRASAVSSREQLPSFFLSRCGEALCSTRPGHDQLSLLPGYRHIAAPSEGDTVAAPMTATEYDLNICRTLPQPQILAYFRLLSPLLGDLLAADSSRFHHRWGSYDGIFTQDISRSLLTARLDRAVFSATALEDYARCPYSYFFKRLLNLLPLEEPEELFSITPLTRGHLLHRILEIFYRTAAREGLLPTKLYPDRCRALLSRICGEQFAGVPPEERPPYPLLWQLQRRVLEETVQAFLAWEIKNAEEFVPLDFEVNFGFRETAGVRVSLRLSPGKTLHFRGRLDRVDRCGSLIRVIDYKTGRKRIKDNHFSGGEALQLPVYLLAAGQIYGLDEPGAAEAHAYHLSPRGVETALFSGDSWPQKELLLQEAVEIIYGGIAAGHFFFFPNPACRYCEYAPICGPDIEKIYRRKADDPLLDSFKKLKEERA